MKFLNTLIFITILAVTGSSQNQLPPYFTFCDTITGETVYVEKVNDIEDCCYVWDGGDLVKRRNVDGTINCDNLVSGPCEYKPTECVESQEWTYGIDNTGTRFNDVADYIITLSDGSTLEFSQDGSSTNWTAQLTEWSNNIQAAADASGLSWLVEPRTVNNLNPTDISGNYGNNPTGLPGAPSVPVAVALIDGGMGARYVNIQICPGQPVPVKAERISSRDFTTNPYTLITAGAILGPIQKFFVCRDCGKEPVWYLEDGVTLADTGQIPFCSEPCGTLTLADAPPDRDCEFQTLIGCDNNNSTNTVDFTNTITRRATLCNGEQITVDYFQEDPNDGSALIAYTLIGDFVDCSTGQPVELPVPECSQFETLGLLYVTGGDAEEGANLDYWQPSALGGSAVGHDNVSNIFTNDGSTFTHPNAPDISVIIPTPSFSTASNFDLLGYDSNGETNGTDQIKISGYFNLPQDALIYDTNNNTGERGLVAIKQCCTGDLTVLSERTTDSNAADRFFFTAVPVPAGIHYYEILTSDLSAWQGLQLSVSFDGGETTEVLKSYSSKPVTECYPVVRCEDTGVLLNGETFDPVTVTKYDTWHPISCESISVEIVTPFDRTPVCFTDADDTYHYGWSVMYTDLSEIFLDTNGDQYTDVTVDPKCDCEALNGGESLRATLPPNVDKIVSDNFQDQQNVPFNLQVRSVANFTVNWEALIENVPYATIPGLQAGNYTLTSQQNADGTYNHLFGGSLGANQSITISGDPVSPPGNGTGLSLYCN